MLPGLSLTWKCCSCLAKIFSISGFRSAIHLFSFKKLWPLERIAFVIFGPDVLSSRRHRRTGGHGGRDTGDGTQGTNRAFLTTFFLYAPFITHAYSHFQSANCSRNAVFLNFPMLVRGISAMNTKASGSCHFAKVCARNAR